MDVATVVQIAVQGQLVHRTSCLLRNRLFYTMVGKRRVMDLPVPQDNGHSEQSKFVLKVQNGGKSISC